MLRFVAKERNRRRNIGRIQQNTPKICDEQKFLKILLERTFGMIQKKYKVFLEGAAQDKLAALGEVHAFWGKFRAVADEINDEWTRCGAKTLFINILFDKIPSEKAQIAMEIIREKLPHAAVVGTSLFPINDEHSITFDCCFFDNSSVKVFEYNGCPWHYEEYGREIGKSIADMVDVKGVLLMCAGVSLNVSEFIDGISENNEDIPFFGAMAGVFTRQANHDVCESIFAKIGVDNEQYIVGNDVYSTGIVTAVFAGKELHIETDVVFGWKPLGKEMPITKTSCGTGVATIDGIPATGIYEKYLGVEPNKRFLENICEFPLVIERNGFEIGRVPPIYDHTGSIYFNGDVRDGETVRLTYGNPPEILRETQKHSEELRRFSPQGVLTYVCGNRYIFLKEDEQKEHNAFLRFAPQLSEVNGSSEIYRYKNKGGILNSALVAVGLREGKKPAALLGEDLQQDEKKADAIPLSTRLATFLDATTRELKASNRELQEMAENAKAASRAKSAFLSNMSHEIRTPINAILGLDEMILRECKDENALEYAADIQAATANLLGIVNDILDFSKIEAGKMEIIPVEYALSSVLNDLVNMIQKRAAKKGLDFIVEADENIPSILFGDEIRIKQVVTNILTNAVKYTEKGSVTLRVTYEEKDENKIYLKFAVKDTGIGIKDEDMGKLFSAFTRIEEKRNRAIEGTGLGMNITQQLLHLMGSKLDVKSVYGKGSTFSFAVEQQVRNHDKMGDFEEAYRRIRAGQSEYHEKFTAPKAKILVVDDTIMNITVVKGLLKRTKVQIDTAESGYECLHMVQKDKYDIIFLDHRMPGMDGIETLQHMKKLPHHLNEDTPVISLTANAVSGAREEYIKAGFDDYLTKPINSAQLELLMLKYLPEEKVTKYVEADDREETTDEELPEWLKNCDKLNVDEGIGHCGSVSDYMDALTVFAESIKSNREEIELYYQREKWRDYTVKVHALKSTARVIGAAELSEKARRLEDAGNGGYIDEIKSHTGELLALYKSYIEVLSPLLTKEKEGDEDKPLIDEAALTDAYETMRDMAKSFDYDSMMFVFDSLAEYRFNDTDRKKLAAVKEAAAKPDWDKVRELLSA